MNETLAESSDGRSAHPTATSSWRSTVVAAMIAIGVVWGSSVLCFGSVSAARAWLNGAAVYAETTVVDVGRVSAGLPQQVDLRIRNLTNHDVTIIGAKTDCRCAVAGGLPLGIAPFDVDHFTVTVTPEADNQETVFEKSVMLFVNVETPPVVIRIRGRATRNPAETARGQSEFHNFVSSNREPPE